MILKDVEPLELFASNYGGYDAESYMAGAEAALNKLDALPVIESERLRPLVKRIKTRKHDWKRNQDGTIDESARCDWFCRGPVCKICNYSFWVQSDEKCFKIDPEIRSEYDKESCIPHYTCGNCNAILKDEDKYCANCGAKLELEEKND